MKKVIAVIMLTSLFGIVIARSPAERMIFSQAVARIVMDSRDLSETYDNNKSIFFYSIFKSLKCLYKKLGEITIRTGQKPVIKAVCLKVKVRKREVIVCRDVK